MTLRTVVPGDLLVTSQDSFFDPEEPCDEEIMIPIGTPVLVIGVWEKTVNNVNRNLWVTVLWDGRRGWVRSTELRRP